MAYENKIGIDFVWFADEEVREGILRGSLAVFLGDILDAILQLHAEDSFVLLAKASAVPFLRERFLGLPICAVDDSVCYLIGSITHRNFDTYNEAIRQNGISRMWFPNMMPDNINGICCPYVGTIHDLLMRPISTDAAYQKMFDDAAGIIAISGFTKSEVLRVYNVPQEKIQVIFNPISIECDHVDSEMPKGFHGNEFILSVNAYSPYKNPLTVLRAYKLIARYIPYDLVMCGGYMWEKVYQSCKDYIRDNGLTDRAFMYLGIPLPEKNWLFEHCPLFVSASENEGFGRTPIEAAMCCKPVLTTKVTSLEEVTCGLLHYFDPPRDYKTLAMQIMATLGNMDSAERLAAIRDAYQQKYAPKKIAKEYLAYFRKMHWLDGNDQ